VKLGGLHRVARQPKLEAKASNESRNGIGSRWGVVAWRRVRSGRWSAERYSDREYDSYSLEEEISDVSLSTFYVFDRENAGARRPGLQLAKRTGSPGKVAEAAQKTAQAEAPHAALAAQPAAPAVDEAGRIDIAECRSHRTRCPPYR
jgi:hypothetical protein